MATALEKNKTSEKSHSRSNEIFAIIGLALAVLVFLSLVTYSPNDWSLNTSSTQKTQNWVGIVGSILADLLFQTVGLTAYFLPAMLILIAWRFFKAKEFSLSIGRFIGYFLFIISISSLAALFGFYGGIVGAFFEQIFSALLGKIGAGILLAAFFATALLLMTNLSFVSSFGSFELAWANLKIRFDEWWTRYRARRGERKKEADARAVKDEEKRRKNEKEKLPTVSFGETPVVDLKNKKSVSEEKSPSIFDRFKTSASELEKEEPPEIVQETEEPETKAAPQEEIVLQGETDLSEGFNAPEEIPISAKIEEQSDDAVKSEESKEIEDSEAEEISPKGKQNFDDYQLPTTEFLTQSPPRIEQKEEQFRAVAQELTDKTKEFNVNGRVVSICPGPVVTTYEFKPDPGVKYSRITSLGDDLCLALKAESIRIDRIPGKAFVGVEVPNQQRETIHLREVIESTRFREQNSLLTMALGKTIDGLNYVADLAKMPHLLIAGATGAGKSVGVNTLVVSILYKAKPDEVKFIMVDPKRLELGVYADIPHLATPIITDPKRAAISLKWAVSEMERRYKELAGWGVRNIDGFNTEVEKKNANEIFDDNGEPHKKLPYIVIIIDELADLMMVSGKEVEESITRLAQMARAVGIHLVLATQRPSVDVITGLIKANFPARISFRVSSKVDSRTIIDSNGAERLLGKGDMLFLPPATSQLIRVHGAFVDEKEIARIVAHIKAQGKPEYDATITKTEEEMIDVDDLPGRKDPLFADALRTVVNNKSASTSLLQRHLRIGYGRAAAILDAMVREGYIGEMDGSKRARPILQKAFDDLQEASEGREL